MEAYQIAKSTDEKLCYEYFGMGNCADNSNNGGNSLTQTLIKVVLTATLHDGNSATFTEPIPADYELYINGQWHNKAMLQETQTDTNTLLIPNQNWHVSESVELKYYKLSV
ncbi:MAG: hypothetical protein U5L45_15900 [Saprospiraceae bacterium]|nr:hypothetical protein [Saprospiraceae bacterium]